MLESTLCDIMLRGPSVVYIVEVGVVGKSIEVEFGIFALLTEIFSGIETRAKVRPEGSDPVLYTARWGRIMFDPFDY